MAKAKEGDTVKCHYTGTLKDGKKFDSSEGRDPIEFKVGEGNVIPGFEQMVVGMEPGEKKTGTIPSDDAYGPRRPELALEVNRDQFPKGVDPEVGQMLEMTIQDGQKVPVTVTGVKDDSITLDANHPLAGFDLTFEIELVSIG